MKKIILRIRKKAALAGFMLTSMLLQFSPVPVNAKGKATGADTNAKGKATGADAVTNSLGDFYAIVAAFVSSVGAIILLWGVFEWGTSMQANDGSMQANAFKRVGGGLVMILAPQIISGFI